MTDSQSQDKQIEPVVAEGLDFADKFVKDIDFKDVQNGKWFLKLLRVVLKTYQKNVHATYFQQKYPGLPADDIADKLISVTTKYAAIGGAIAGIATTASIAGIVASGGISATVWLGSIGTEIVYVSWLQMRLVLDLTVVYDLQIDANDPEDILMIFSYALGVIPSSSLGKGIAIVAGSTTKQAIQKYISGGLLKSLQGFFKQLGFKILKRSLVKFAVPIVSALAGSSYNYITTRSIGRIAKSHFSNRGVASEKLRRLISKQLTYDIVLPASLLYMAQLDGKFSRDERELYKSMLTRMSLESHNPQDFQKLVENETDILAIISELPDDTSSTLFELLVLMAVYDGHLDDKESNFLTRVAAQLNIQLDIDAIRRQADEYRIETGYVYWRKMTHRTSKSFKVTKETTDQLLGQEQKSSNQDISPEIDKVS